MASEWKAITVEPLSKSIFEMNWNVILGHLINLEPGTRQLENHV